MIVNANVDVYVNSNLLQVMVFSKSLSEKEIDEMHSNYSKWFHYQVVYTLGVWLTKLTANNLCQQKSTEETVLHNLTSFVKMYTWVQYKDLANGQNAHAVTHL